ncbi:MAG: hypothetical protein OXC08_00795 [Thiotrichales bacterium]|nr:hypothetical protein [Thiotrichales bacterium]
MHLAENPFYTLGATAEDGRRRIAELAEEKSLVEDEASIREARSVLTNPRRRLAAEVAWLPGLGPERVAEAISVLDVYPGEIRRIANLPALARANLLADAMVRAGSSLAGTDIAQWIVEFSEAYERVHAVEIVALLNEARSTAGLAAITNQASVEEELQGRRRHFRDAIKRCLDQLPTSSLVDAVTLVVDHATNNGSVHAPILIDDLVDTYEVEAQEFLNKETENVRTIVQQIRDGAEESADEDTLDGLVAKLKRVVKNWDYVAQPIQVSFASRGLSHGLSHEVAREIRELAVELYNEHRLLEVSKRLTEIQQEVFAEIAKITEQLDDDAARLDEITEERTEIIEEMNAQAESWAREITYEADVGVMQSKLRISPAGVHWKGTTIGLEEITRVRWSETKNSVRGIPTGTTYHITVGCGRTFVQIELKKREIFNEFVDRLWKTAGVRLLTEILNPIVAKTAGFCSDSGAGVQNGEGMTQVSFESCVTVH